MSVVLSVEDTGPCEKQLKIEIPAATVDAESSRIAAEFRREAKLPGFRKGKVPMELVRQRFGGEIEEEVVERLLPRYWHQAEGETQLDALLPPAVADVVHEAGENLTFTATVEVRPEFALESLDDFEIPAPVVEATDEQIEKMLEDLRRSVAPWVEVERAAAQGDLVEASLHQGGGDDEAQQVAFEVGDPNVWEELSLEVTGKKAGQSGTFERLEAAGGSDDGSDEGEKKKQEYAIELAAVKERELPPLDDALAAKIGKFETLAELEADVGRQLSAGKRHESQRLREAAVLDQLRERNPTGLPKRVLDQELRQMLTDYAEHLAERGVDASKADVDWQKLTDQVRPQAEARVHARLLLDAVAGKLEIEVSEEVFEATLAGLARAQGRSAAQLRQKLDHDGRLQELRAQLRREGALKRLLGEEDSLEAKDSETAADTAAGDEE